VVSFASWVTCVTSSGCACGTLFLMAPPVLLGVTSVTWMDWVTGGYGWLVTPPELSLTGFLGVGYGSDVSASVSCGASIALGRM